MNRQSTAQRNSYVNAFSKGQLRNLFVDTSAPLLTVRHGKVSTIPAGTYSVVKADNKGNVVIKSQKGTVRLPVNSNRIIAFK